MAQAKAIGRFVAAAVQPLTAVVSVVEGNRFGLPSPQTLGRLEPRPVFRTDVHGDIEISTDGERLWVEVERGGEGSVDRERGEAVLGLGAGLGAQSTQEIVHKLAGFRYAVQRAGSTLRVGLEEAQ